MSSAIDTPAYESRTAQTFMATYELIGTRPRARQRPWSGADQLKSGFFQSAEGAILSAGGLMREA